MAFSTDKQTLDDLNIFGHHGGDSIYNMFNRCTTRGGAAVLEAMFRNPMSDAYEINRRSRIIQYFSLSVPDFPLHSSLFDAVEIYLANTDERTKLLGQEQTLREKLRNKVAMDVMTAQIHNGIAGMAEIVNVMHRFIDDLPQETDPVYIPELADIRMVLAQPIFVDLFKRKAKFGLTAMGRLDDALRFRNGETIRALLNKIYHLDVYIAVGRVAGERQFSFPKALKQEQGIADMQGVFHPQVDHAVPNNIRITPQGNVIFLTGANMAGKSTFMKSISIALYLAHMGFPTAAASMQFSVLDGLYTTINLPDNLGMGASHFYSEVLRVKKVAEELKHKNLFVLFDELFRGTNVKDAAEATIAVAEAFARKRHSIFVLSTHIIEAGEELMKRCENIRFVYLPTRMEGEKPVYTYQLKEGITQDRHGMIIINNEGILEMLEAGIRNHNE